MKSLFSLEQTALSKTLVFAEQGSFHMAASRLGVNTSTLGRRVHELKARSPFGPGEKVAVLPAAPTIAL
jgi:hypothetical protein